MPLNEGDVLNTLSDPVTAQLDFWVGAVHISGKWLGIIRDHVRAGNILVKPGSKGTAEYDQKTDIITTQQGNSPADMGQRSLLLHECVHALVDIFYPDNTITRHNGEVAAYITQFTYKLRSNPNYIVGPDNIPWFVFYTSVVTLARKFNLNKTAGNGTRISLADIEPLRVQLAALPGVNYGDYDKDDKDVGNGLLRNNPFLDTHEDTTPSPVRISARETYPDPTDDYLIRTLQEKYGASDVAGYGGRLRELRRAFALCSLGRAKALSTRLSVRKSGDKVAELFYDRLSAGGRAILLRVLRTRS
jgi:hypothetical protein